MCFGLLVVSLALALDFMISKGLHKTDCYRYQTFNDIFTIEANEYLRSKGIYLIEDKEVNYLDASNRNTREITKNLLVPLINKFRPQIVKAILNADPSEYVKYIGELWFQCTGATMMIL